MLIRLEYQKNHDDDDDKKCMTTTTTTSQQQKEIRNIFMRTFPFIKSCHIKKKKALNGKAKELVVAASAAKAKIKRFIEL